MTKMRFYIRTPDGLRRLPLKEPAALLQFANCKLGYIEAVIFDDARVAFTASYLLPFDHDGKMQLRDLVADAMEAVAVDRQASIARVADLSKVRQAKGNSARHRYEPTEEDKRLILADFRSGGIPYVKPSPRATTMHADNKNKLLGSDELTREEEALRSELRAWCRGKLASGTRPVPLCAALRIVADQMNDPEGSGIGKYKPKRGRLTGGDNAR